MITTLTSSPMTSSLTHGSIQGFTGPIPIIGTIGLVTTILPSHRLHHLLFHSMAALMTTPFSHIEPIKGRGLWSVLLKWR